MYENTKQTYFKVFLWMMIGLCITLCTALFIFNNSLVYTRLTSGYVPIIILIVHIAAVALIGFIMRRSPTWVMVLLFFLIATIMGITCATYFVIFSATELMYAFLTTAIIFGIFALIGIFTKIDLSKLGVYLLFLLSAVLVLEIINLFLLNNTLNMILCIVGLVIIIAYIAYDMQKLKKFAHSGYTETKVSIWMALCLYIDFMSLFLRLLRLYDRVKKI